MTDNRTQMPFGSHMSGSTYIMNEDLSEHRPANLDIYMKSDPTLRKFQESDAAGYGIERCLYELNPELSCLSPPLIHAAALTPGEALIALETVASQPNRPSFPVDRHLAAFLISRWKGMSMVTLMDLAKPQREVRNLGALKILAGIQKEYKIKELPNLCEWMAQLCAPMTSHYHNLIARARIQEEVTRVIATGQLGKLLRILENREALQEDYEDYQAAKIEVLLIESEIREMESKIRNQNRVDFTNAPGILGTIERGLHAIKNAMSVRIAKNRMFRLFQRADNLRETWGQGLAPQRGNVSLDYGKKLWQRFRGRPVPHSSAKIHVDGWMKYD